MGAMVPQIDSIATVYSTVYSGTDQRKFQISASLTFVRGIHWWPVNSPHKTPVTRKMLQFDDVINREHMLWGILYLNWLPNRRSWNGSLFGFRYFLRSSSIIICSDVSQTTFVLSLQCFSRMYIVKCILTSFALLMLPKLFFLGSTRYRDRGILYFCKLNKIRTWIHNYIHSNTNWMYWLVHNFKRDLLNRR